MPGQATKIISEIEIYAGILSELHCIPQLAEYIDRLVDTNKKINLFSRKMALTELIQNHLIDSLLPLPFLPKCRLIADLGSGGGFPAIPLAILNSSTEFHLYEKSPLKRRFLESLHDLVPNMTVKGSLLDTPLDPKPDLIISRAFKSIPATLDLTRQYLRNGGHYMLYQGKRSKIEDSLTTVKNELSGTSYRIQKLATPENRAERHLLWIG